MTGLVFATEDEARPFLKRFRGGRFEGLMEGDLLQDEGLVLSLSGIGKIKATLSTERLLQRVRLQRLVHVGTCTALDANLAPGTLVGVPQVLEGDRIDLSVPAYPRMPLELLFPELTQATLVTQDHTPADQKEQTYWQRIAGVSDTTGYAVGFVTATYGIPCHIVKVVTGHMKSDDRNFRRTHADACAALASFLLEKLVMLRAA